MKKFFAQAYLWILLILLYAPILIIVIFSFTESKVLGNWTGFSFGLYQNILSGKVGMSFLKALENTVSIGILAAIISKRKAIMFLNDIPMLNPDIITGVSLFLLFVAFSIPQGYLTVLLAHVSFCTPYVILCVLPKLRQMDPNLYEAALDLGATPRQALNKVIFPQIRPAMISGFILAFTLSIDDFAVTLFTKGNKGFENLSTYIYADAHKGGLTPELRPIMSMIFVFVLLLLIIINIRSSRNHKKQEIRI